MNAVSHVADGVYRGHLEYVSLVVREVGVSLDGGSNVLQLCAFLQFYVNHTAVQTLALRNGHGESILHALLRAYTNAVTH